MTRLLKQLSRLDRDEEGSSLIFAAITLFSVTLTIMYVYQIGLVSTDRIQIQNAADAAAYSAAQVEANALNSIGQVNDAMTYLNYLMLRYTVDAVVYDTLQTFENHQRPGATGEQGYVLMGGGTASYTPDEGDNTYEGRARYDHAQANTADALAEGKKWVQDLHQAARAIMEVTPKLINRTAAEVAAFNGASHIAISEDVELAFQLNSPARDSDGFAERTGEVFSPSMHKRYGRGERPVWQVKTITDELRAEARLQNLPDDWFAQSSGKINSAYSQVRLCWNEKDWIHDFGMSQPHGYSPPYSEYRSGGPNEHWHLTHTHMDYRPTLNQPVPLPPIPLDPHGGIDGTKDTKGPHYNFGTVDDDPAIHDIALYEYVLAPSLNPLLSPPPHHAVKECPTCEGKQTPASQWSEILKTTEDARSNFQSHYRLYNGFFPRPLLIKTPLLQSGITVVTWREGRGLGEIFREPDWGMVAVASAAIGYQTPEGGVVPLTEIGATSTYSGALDGATQTHQVIALEAGDGSGGGDDSDPNHKNLFYSNTPSEGVRFGARLVPIAGEFTTHAALSGGVALNNLLGGARWQDVTNISDPPAYLSVDDPNDATGWHPGLLAPRGPRRLSLQDVVVVNSQDSLDAFWH